MLRGLTEAPLDEGPSKILTPFDQCELGAKMSDQWASLRDQVTPSGLS